VKLLVRILVIYFFLLCAGAYAGPFTGLIEGTKNVCSSMLGAWVRVRYPHSKRFFDQQTTELRQALKTGEVVRPLIVLTHLMTSTSDWVARFARTDELNNMLIVTLIDRFSWRGPLPFSRWQLPFLKDRIVKLYSRIGEFDGRLVSPEIYLAGGSTDCCLKATLDQLIATFEESSLTGTQITLLRPALYPLGSSDEKNLANLLGRRVYEPVTGRPNAYRVHLPNHPERFFLIQFYP